MQTADDLLFARINCLPVPNKGRAAQEILSTNFSFSFQDTYRNTTMLSLMTKNARVDKDGNTNNQQGTFEWTSIAPKSIIDWCENIVFPWLGMRTRIMALITKPGVAMFEHFDCSPNELHTRQHKFRFVVQGDTNSLYWLTDSGKVHAPKVDEAFIIDGGWPHGMVNTSNEIKITLALGSPWAGKLDYNGDLEILQNKSNYKMPKNIDHLWEKKYNVTGAG